MTELQRTKRLAIIRVRGINNVRKSIDSTCKLLNVARLHNLSFIDDRPAYQGMLKKAKDWITWGEPNLESTVKILTKWGRLPGNKRLTDEYIAKHTPYKNIEEFAKAFLDLKAEIKDIPGLKPFFRLHPPRKGYDRGGIKRPVTIGGALGYRGERINQLIEKMT